MIHDNIAQLLRYALEKDLIRPDDRMWAANRLIAALGLDRWEEPARAEARPLEDTLRDILDWAVENGKCEPGIASRDILDTELMGILTPRPSEVRRTFFEKYAQDPQTATDWYYAFSQDTDYIRRYRIVKDMKWVAPTEYGELDITVNLSKPEKDPRAIAAAKLAPQNAYPACQLCASNEGYHGRLDHPARQNLRLIPLTLDGQDRFFQYSPYVYYNEHLPIVGGSILSHDHFQGGRYTFAMAKAPVERPFTFPGYEDVQAGTVKWPMSVIRLQAADPDRLVDLADRILLAWRGYSDPAADILAQTGGERHNTVTPIARMRDGQFELDLVLRNNRTTDQYPLGIFHPHQELHHIKKENIGLIEVMGLAVLPSRLKTELEALREALLTEATRPWPSTPTGRRACGRGTPSRRKMPCLSSRTRWARCSPRCWSTRACTNGTRPAGPPLSGSWSRCEPRRALPYGGARRYYFREESRYDGREHVPPPGPGLGAGGRRGGDRLDQPTLSALRRHGRAVPAGGVRRGHR